MPPFMDTEFHTDLMNLSWYPPTPNDVRSTRHFFSANCGRAKYSTCARSGMPLPAEITFCNLVYSSAPDPAFTTLTLTFGYFASNALTRSLICGIHVHTVNEPPLANASETPLV